MPAFTARDSNLMARALRLAARGLTTTRPNPAVGCVIAREDRVLGEGWHRRAGGAHAEVYALEAAGDSARGATAYVSLEPCAHHGRTPPCADALLAAGIGRVVVATEDPNPAVEGRGIERLRAASIDVDVGLMAAEARALIAGFVSRMQRGRPLVRLKLALSLDGAMAMASGESQWITGQAARADVQRWRARSGAILTGVGTVLADDPLLTLREPSLCNAVDAPLRVIADSRLRTPADARILKAPGRTLICHAGDAANTGRAAFPDGVELLAAGAAGGAVDLEAVFRELATRGVNEVLVEAGPRLAGSLLQAGAVDELVIYQAAHMMGSNTLRAIETPDWQALSDRLSLSEVDRRRVGEDTRIIMRPAG